MKELKIEIERLNKYKDVLHENIALKGEIEYSKNRIVDLRRVNNINNRKFDDCNENFGQ